MENVIQKSEGALEQRKYFHETKQELRNRKIKTAKLLCNINITICQRMLDNVLIDEEILSKRHAVPRKDAENNTDGDI